MKFILNILIGFVIFTKIIFSQDLALHSFHSTPNLRMLMMRFFGKGQSRQMFEDLERQKNETLSKEKLLWLLEKEEEVRRKIIVERLKPLIRGNAFMRDFYSGRF